MSVPENLAVALLAAGVVWMCALTALNLATRCTGARGWARWGLLAAAASALGSGIWVSAVLGVWGVIPGVTMSATVVTVTFPLALLMALYGLLGASRPRARTVSVWVAGFGAGFGMALMHALVITAVQVSGAALFDISALCLVACAAGVVSALFCVLIRRLIYSHNAWAGAGRIGLAVLIAAGTAVAHAFLVATQPGAVVAPDSLTTGLDQATLALVMAGLLTAVFSGIQVISTVHTYAEHRTRAAATELRASMARLDREVRQHQRAQQDLAAANATLRERLVADAQTRADMSALARLSQELQQCVTNDELRAAVLGGIDGLLPTSAGTLLLPGSEGAGYVTLLAWGNPSGSGCFEDVACRALRDGRTHWTSAGEHDRRCTHLAQLPAGHRSACIPLVGLGAQLGLLCLEFPEQGEAAALRVQRLVLGVTDRLSLTLASIQMRKNAVSDPLTGLYNRRLLEDALVRELARAQRDGRHLSVMLMDVDEFKSYNDHFGHAAGDQALRAVARVLQNTVRAGDVVCRFGGEEFVILMPDSRVHEAVSRAREIGAAVRQLLMVDPRLRRRITVSAGVAGYPAHGDSPAALLHQADLAMYGAKMAGRDRVKIAGSDVSNLSDAL